MTDFARILGALNSMDVAYTPHHAAAQGRRLADVSRDALDEYVARHAS